ncbi:MAG: histone deacetylase [Gemmatimonadota bacterium]|nr:histone deacetylase [Gemmatimonadota bacterium]
MIPVVWSPAYEVHIGPHVFPTVKYRLVVERLEAEGVLGRGEIHHPEPASWDELALVHSEDYLAKVREGRLTHEDVLRLETPFSAELRDAWILCCGGTLLTARLALAHGAAAHIGGGFHHAFSGHGEGFCLLNDVAMAAAAVLQLELAERVAVVDLDVHHGNGTAAIFRDEPRVFTFSMHQENNYPAHKLRGDLDVGLDDGTGDEEYLDLLSHHLSNVLDDFRPDLILYLAGADPYRQDQLGGLGLSKEGLRTRDETVVGSSAAAGVAVAATLAGGYAVNTGDTVDIHCDTVKVVLDSATGWT